ncbi:likely trna dihydrouridine synthase [Moniliophthora roreri MCA 2997]|uniref:tRNA-dihydrouridine(16/17) synthase [NAD(P)(+)] n=1 Tax=Moniliophthora roreri (strain MCA 2997) TaxID=1381753 RepID=V2X1N1_MONRO|nr:likely trna dihydrouridine synthase [Moniliophthora roreri MCA 2997]
MTETSSSSAMERPRKLQGYQLYREVLGSPKYIVAPMVDQSELAWRRLSRRYGAQLIYTPMINAKMWSDPRHHAYRTAAFDIASGEEGDPSTDRPLIIQFCANDPDKLLESAKALEGHCDAIDINLGCPQDIAKKGKYGAFLMDDWDLIYRLINILHKNLSIPVTAKFRVFPTVEKTVEYAKMLESAGAQILTCHGRLREQRGQNAGLADWSKIRAVKEAVSVPVFANGNILFQSDIQRCLDETDCDGVMSAEGQLYNVALFNGLDASDKTSSLSSTLTPHTPITSTTHPSHADLALEYLEVVHSIRTRTAVSAIKGHLFKIMRPALSRETDLRERLGRAKIRTKEWEGGGKWDMDEKSPLWEYIDVCREMKRRMDRDAEEAMEVGKDVEELVVIEETTGLRVLPHWIAQPYFRVAKKLPQQQQQQLAKVPVDEGKALNGAQGTASADVTRPTSVPAKRPIVESNGTEAVMSQEEVGKRVRLAA